MNRLERTTDGADRYKKISCEFERVDELLLKTFIEAHAAAPEEVILERGDILDHAYRMAKANGGARGVDGVTFEQIESQGREEWLRSLQQDLRSR